jgi:hypothetical protein
MIDTWLMQYEETGPIYCKNHTGHTSTIFGPNTSAVRKVSSHFEYLENRSHGLRTPLTLVRGLYWERRGGGDRFSVGWCQSKGLMRRNVTFLLLGFFILENWAHLSRIKNPRSRLPRYVGKELPLLAA